MLIKHTIEDSFQCGVECHVDFPNANNPEQDIFNKQIHFQFETKSANIASQTRCCLTLACTLHNIHI